MPRVCSTCGASWNQDLGVAYFVENRRERIERGLVQRLADPGYRVTLLHAPLFGPTLAGLDKVTEGFETVTVHLDRGYGGKPTHAPPAELGSLA